MRAQSAFVIGVLYVAAGCDLGVTATIAVAPNPVLSRANAQDAAFGLIARTATGFGLEPFEPRGPLEEEGWRTCFAGRGLDLCGRVLDHEVQIRFWQLGTTRLTPLADSVKAELLDVMRARFGQDRVREWD